MTGGEADVALMASAVLMATDRLDVAFRTWDAEATRAVRAGSPVQFGYALTVRACLTYRRGRLADAEADAQPADDTLVEHGIALARRYSLAFLVGALVERGETTAPPRPGAARSTPPRGTLPSSGLGARGAVLRLGSVNSQTRTTSRPRKGVVMDRPG